jgi:hypothetical protein
LLRQSAADAAAPLRLGTEARAELTDHQLRQAGIEPGDPTLYKNPLDSK